MKIVFLTFHNYITKAQGGFHLFARELAKNNEVVFFTYPRSWFVYYKKTRDPVYNDVMSVVRKPVLKDNVLNVTSLFFIPPKKIMKFMPTVLIEWLHKCTFPSFNAFCDKYFEGADCLIFESTPSVYLWKFIKRKYPSSKLIYRPSDPIIANSLLQLYHAKEIEFMQNADMTFIVNEVGEKLYERSIPDFRQTVKYKVLSNGVDVASYRKNYPRPEVLKGDKIAIYVGAAPIEWKLVIESAVKLPQIDIYIVYPALVPDYFLEAVEKNKNLHFINGILPSEVPAFIKNSDVVIVPYETGRYKNFAWGITAKYYQAMAAEKPIIAYQDTKDLEQLDIRVADTYDEFINYLEYADYTGGKKYDFDFSSKEWSVLATQMLDVIKSL